MYESWPRSASTSFFSSRSQLPSSTPPHHRFSPGSRLTARQTPLASPIAAARHASRTTAMYPFDDPHVNNPESLALNVILASALSPPFAVIFVALRFYTAHRILKKIRLDDWLVLVALIFAIGYSTSLIILTRYGLGQHMAYLYTHLWWGPEGLEVLKRYQLMAAFPISMTNNLGTLFVKVSVLCFYLRFATTRRFKVVIYIVVFVVVVAYLLGAMSVLFFCRPISFFWKFEPLDGYCYNPDPWYAWLIIFNCVTDFVLLVLPVWIIYPLNVGFAQKAAIVAILGTGGFILGVSILRVVIVAGGWGDNDGSYRFATNYVWSVIETNLAIVCACAPCLRTLIGRFIPALMQLVGRRNTTELSTILITQPPQRLPSPAILPNGRQASKEFGSDLSSNNGRGHPVV
ncbi:hypothetical protein VTK26DRAFT_8768 [Humicola hyalothermophila]